MKIQNPLSFKTITFSFFIHFLFLIILFLSAPVKKKKDYKISHYRVSLSYIPKKVEKMEKNLKAEEGGGSGLKVPEKTKKKEIKEGMKPLKGKIETPTAEKFSKETLAIEGTKVEGIDATYFPFDYYLNQVLSFISSNWYKPAADEGTYCIVYFIILKNGRILDAKIEKSSENSAFDRAALRAVLASNPLPPLPYGYYEENLGIHLRFE